MRITRAVVPSLFTVLNAFCGFLSIVHATEGRFEAAAIFIILAGLFDTLDGFMARLTKSASRFGVELDSLSDVVSFGAAPSVLVYLAHLHQYNTIGLLISAFPLVFGAIRLARFNVQLVGFDKDYFTGLPIPHQALTVSAFFLAYDGQNGISGFASIMLAPLVVILGLLMVSRVKYDTLPKFTKREIRHHPWKTALYAIGTLIVIVSLGKLFFEVMLATVFIGIIRSFIHFFSKKQIEPQKEALEEREISSIDI